VLLAVCLLTFAIRLVRAWQGRKRSAERTILERWSQRVATASSIVSLVFVAVFLVMLVRVMQTYLFPDSVFALLVLPIVTTVLTAALVALTAVSWAKSDGTVKRRLCSTVFTTVSVAFVWFLNYWNLLGWRY
jgi:hypothetical protein